MNDRAESCRVDVWLWRARFVKTRGLAARIVAAGQVRLWRNGARLDLEKPGRALRPGDVLVVALGERPRALRIEALGQRRGPAPEARTLYRRLDDDHWRTAKSLPISR